MKAYNHLQGFLLRWTVLKIGRLHIRVHHIISSDGTPFLHTHPFNYISIIFKGGYEEEILNGDKLEKVQNKIGSIIFRNHKTPHRIIKVKGDICKTFFITWVIGDWKLIKHKDIIAPSTYKTPVVAGIYKRKIQDKDVYAKFDGFWYSSKDNIEEAENSTTPSVYQCGDWEDLK